MNDELYATSTVAMSAYNMLAVQGRPFTTKAIFNYLSSEPHPGLKKTQVKQGLAELKKLGLVRSSREGFQINDPKRRLCVSRDRSGDGWDGWKVRDLQRGLIPIEEVLI